MNKDIIYRIDARDDIEYANDEYDRFALENDGAESTRAKVLNRSIWDFIGDATTREIYHELFRRARGGRTARFRFRCDSPAVRRLLEMEISRTGGDGLEFRIRPISIETRPEQKILDARLPRTSELLVICGWCKRIQIDGGWEETESAVAQLNLLEASNLPMLTHGICDRCSEEMLRSTLDS